MTEVWKDIEGYEGEYQVSNMGRVKSLARVTTRTSRYGERLYRIPEKIMKTRMGTSGYLCVNFRQDGKPVTLMVHRLVALHFVSGYEDGLIVNHKDENRQNNRADNLEWCTYKYNNNYGNAKALRYEKLRKTPVAMFKPDGTLVRTFPTMKEAERFIGKRGAGQNIRLSCDGTTRHRISYGYKWSFVINGVPQPPKPDPTPEQRAASSRLKSEHHGRKRAIQQIADDGSVIAEYDSITKAAQAVGVSQSGIRLVAIGKPGHHKSGGFKWKFKE